MDYEKAMVEIILFNNCDVITTSGLDSTNTGSTGCNTPGQNRGNGCNGNSGKCPGQSWK